MRILIAVIQPLPLTPFKPSEYPALPTPVCISALSFSFSFLPCGRTKSPVQKCGLRPLPGAEWKCQRLLNIQLFFLVLPLGTLSLQVCDFFLGFIIKNVTNLARSETPIYILFKYHSWRLKAFPCACFARESLLSTDDCSW